MAHASQNERERRIKQSVGTSNTLWIVGVSLLIVVMFVGGIYMYQKHGRATSDPMGYFTRGRARAPNFAAARMPAAAAVPWAQRTDWV